jgi:hypothetical protein
MTLHQLSIEFSELIPLPTKMRQVLLQSLSILRNPVKIARKIPNQNSNQQMVIVVV